MSLLDAGRGSCCIGLASAVLVFFLAAAACCWAAGVGIFPCLVLESRQDAGRSSCSSGLDVLMSAGGVDCSAATSRLVVAVFC
jgi:hypothetical protein